METGRKVKDLESLEIETAEGVQTGDSPYLMPETNPNPYRDAHTPSEKFVPAPTVHTDEENRGQRILRYVTIGLLLVFIIVTFIAIWKDAPQTLFKGDTGRGHFFR